MRGVLVFLVAIAAVSGDAISAYHGESIEHIEKTLGEATFSIQGSSSEPSDDVYPVALAQRNFIEDIIKDVLDSFRDVVVNGNEDLPPLDPLVVDQAGPFEYRENGIRATINAQNVRLEGLRWYTVDDVTFNLLRLGFGVHMTFPWIDFNSGYDAQVRLALFINHNAGGNIRVFIHRLEVSVDGRLGTNLLGGGHLTLREFQVKISVADVQLRFEGLTGSSLVNALINSYIQNLTRDIIEEQLNQLSSGLSEHLFVVVNEFLREYTLDDLLGIGSKRV